MMIDGAPAQNGGAEETGTGFLSAKDKSRAAERESEDLGPWGHQKFMLFSSDRSQKQKAKPTGNKTKDRIKGG